MLRLLDGEIYQQARVRRYVLLRLDEELANNPGVSYDHKIITVEHVLRRSRCTSSVIPINGVGSCVNSPGSWTALVPTGRHH